MSYKVKVPYDLAKPGDAAQLDCLRRAVDLKRFGVFFQQRVGKTRVAIDFIGHSISRGAKRVLVLCPLCAQAGWRHQMHEYLGDTGKKVALHVAKVTTEIVPYAQHYDVHAVVCTYDKAIRAKTALTHWKPDIVILDEAHLLKNRTSARSKTAYHVAKNATGVLGLTGTPYSNKKYTDLFGMFRAINPAIFGTRWGDFEARYCIKGGYMGYDVVGHKNEDELLSLVDENSMRVLRKDVMTEPEAEDIRVLVELTPSEMKYYRAMEKECVLMLGGEPKVTADMVTTQRTKLQQITSGSVKQDDGEYLQVGKSKLEATLDLIDTIEGKVVVVCKYVEDAYRLHAAMPDSEVITGADPAPTRTYKVDVWEKTLITQEQTMSMGVDLSGASDMVFYSWGDDSLTHSQVRDRIVGRNQLSDTVHYHYMICEKTIDGKLYKALKNNISFAEQAANWHTWLASDA